jgi:hypothetical protein
MAASLSTTAAERYTFLCPASHPDRLLICGSWFFESKPQRMIERLPEPPHGWAPGFRYDFLQSSSLAEFTLNVHSMEFN